jgi:hypothetical protein
MGQQLGWPHAPRLARAHLLRPVGGTCFAGRGHQAGARSLARAGRSRQGARALARQSLMALGLPRSILLGGTRSRASCLILIGSIVQACQCTRWPELSWNAR